MVSRQQKTLDRCLELMATGMPAETAIQTAVDTISASPSARKFAIRLLAIQVAKLITPADFKGPTKP